MIEPPPTEPLRVGRYAVFDAIASGGMATVHLGRQLGAAGFARTVAIKRLHPGHAQNADFVAMFIDEARLAARIQHPHVVVTLDVVSERDELFLVMEYVPGESLAGLLRGARERGESVPWPVASAILAGVLHGLHAAHEATSEDGTPLGVVHRDVSPQNVLVGLDGLARVLDFGIAKANVRLTTTEDGQMKGKLAYMAPEQIRSDELTRRSDVYAAGVVLWEVCAGRRMFATAGNQGAILGRILSHDIEPLATIVPALPAGLDELVQRAYAPHPDARFQTAKEMALALERIVPPASPSVVGSWVRSLARDALEARAQRVARIERWIASEDASRAAPNAAPSGRAAVAAAPLPLETSDPSAVTAPQGVAAAARSRPNVDAERAGEPSPAEGSRGRAARRGALLAAVVVAAGGWLAVRGRNDGPVAGSPGPDVGSSMRDHDVQAPGAVGSSRLEVAVAEPGPSAAESSSRAAPAPPAASAEPLRRASSAALTSAPLAPSASAPARRSLPVPAGPTTPVSPPSKRPSCDPPTEHDPAFPDNPARLRIKPGCR